MGGGAFIRLDWLSAMLFGWIEVRYFNGIFMRLSKEKLLIFESRMPFRLFKEYTNFVGINKVGIAFLAPENINQLPVTAAAVVGSMFAGRGVRIGGAAIVHSNTIPTLQRNQQIIGHLN